MFKIGMVGAGAIGKSHRRAIDANSECSLVAVCDINEANALVVTEGTDARVYSDYKEMAEKETLDIVIINLPHFLHKDVSVYFLEKGINVLVEKPMANTKDECDAMVAAAKKSGAALLVGHVQKYHDCYRTLKKMIEEGRFGKLCSITEERNQDYFPNRPAWFLNKAQSGGGIITNFGAHTLDKVMYTTGLHIEDITALGNNFITDHDVAASVQMLVKFSDGVSGAFTYCGTHISGRYETNFYFTDAIAQIRSGYQLWVSENKGEFVRMDNDGEHYPNLIGRQLEEVAKYLSGKESEIVLPDYAIEIVQAMEKAVNMM